MKKSHVTGLTTTLLQDNHHSSPGTMASPLLFRFLHRPHLLSVPIGVSLLVLHSSSHSTIRCDHGPPLAGPGGADWRDKPGPFTKIQCRGPIDVSTVRQISLGSVMGLLVGVGLRAFSRTLVFMVGLGIIVIQV
jgi:hypothetical protein